MLRGALVAAVVAALILAGPPASAAQPGSDPTCGAPLGFEAASRANAIVEPSVDPEYATVDALRLPGAQRSPETMVAAWGRLVLVAEAKVDLGANFTWGIFVRFHSNTTGWNTTPLWFSSPDTSQYYPNGTHIRPSAVLWRDRLWVAWDAQGSDYGGPFDRMILLRSVDANGSVGPTLRASSTDPNRTTQHPFLLATPDALVLAYSTSDGDLSTSDAHIVVRAFDGGSFGPTEAVTNLSDGWADALPAMALDAAGGLHLAWASTNPTGTAARLMFSANPSGSWTAPLPIAELGATPSSTPAIALAFGDIFVAYTSQYAPDLNGSDADVFMLRFSVTNRTFSPPRLVNPNPSNGDDTSPTLAFEGNVLYVGWGTNEDLYYATGQDTDSVYRTFDGGQFGAVVVLSNSALNNSDGSPSFVAVGGHVYAHWMMTPPPIVGTPRGDSREVVKLVTRPAQWYDGLNLTYRFVTVSENGSSLLEVVAAPPNRIMGHDMWVRVPSGALFALSPSPSGARAWVPIEPSRPDFEVLACGKPIQTPPAPPAPTPGPSGSPANLLVALAIAMTASALVIRLVRASRRPPRAVKPPERDPK